MESPAYHFPVFIGVSLLAFVAILRICTRQRLERPAWRTLAWLSALVVVGGMLFARYGARTGLPVWTYYGVPALMTLVLPPVVLRLRGRETAVYLVLAFLSSPAIHVVFSLFLDWHEYLPFVYVPYLFR